MLPTCTLADADETHAVVPLLLMLLADIAGAATLAGAGSHCCSRDSYVGTIIFSVLCTGRSRQLRYDAYPESVLVSTTGTFDAQKDKGTKFYI